MNGRASAIDSARLSQGALARIAVCGVALGVAYTLSPLSVWFAIGVVLLSGALLRGLDRQERRIILAIFIVAALARVLIVAGLFLSVDHWRIPFGSIFGDEEYFKRRSLWLRSMALHVNISEADRTYALDEYSETSYLYVLAFVQILVGDAPYGVHLFSILAYLAAAVWLFRFARSAFGPAPAGLTFAGVLFLPTLFAWSLSALRESLHLLLTIAAIASGAQALKAARWRPRVFFVAVAAAAAYGLKDLRTGSMGVVVVAIVGGIAAAIATAHWRRFLVVLTIGAVVAGIALSRPSVQDRLLNMLRATALTHSGYAFTPGTHYKTLDPRFYRERGIRLTQDMTWDEARRYVIRSFVAAILGPLPWQAETRPLQAYLPEHLVWLAMVVLLPFGVVAGMRRDRIATSILVVYVALMFTGIALRSGNFGTLVRHRSLVLPFVICLSAVAVCHLLARRGRAPLPERISTDGAD